MLRSLPRRFEALSQEAGRKPKSHMRCSRGKFRCGIIIELLAGGAAMQAQSNSVCLFSAPMCCIIMPLGCSHEDGKARLYTGHAQIVSIQMQRILIGVGRALPSRRGPSWADLVVWWFGVQREPPEACGCRVAVEVLTFQLQTNSRYTLWY